VTHVDLFIRICKIFETYKNNTISDDVNLESETHDLKQLGYCSIF